MALDTPAATAELLSRIADRIGTPSARLFAALLLAEAAETLVGTAPETLADLVLSAYGFSERRPRGRHLIRTRPATWHAAGGDRSDPVTIVEIANDDMPFLVDSVVGELQAQGLTARLLLHPILKMERKPTGELVRILGGGDRNWADGAQESLIVVVLDRIGDARAADLATDLGLVLDDVRAAVTDWHGMLDRIDRAIDGLQSAPPPIAPGLLSETLSFCRWLRDGHFTFLGMREHMLRGRVEDGTLEAAPGHGLGVLRDTRARTLSRNRTPLGLSDEVRRHLAAPEPLIVSKSNLLSRVHRRVHMDYIGLKTYHADGAVAGELRIVGLFTSTAYTQPVREIPLIRHKAEAVTSESGYPPQSHAGKTIANIIETFPRDELFQIPRQELAAWVAAILDLDVRPRPRLLLRRDRFERFVSALVFVPRDRFTTETRERIGTLLATAFGGRISSFRPSFTEGPLVRVHFIVGLNPAPVPAVDVHTLERDIADAIRSWDDQLADALGAAETDLLARYVAAFSPGYMGSFAPGRALEDIGRMERLGDGALGIDFENAEDGVAQRARAIVLRRGQPLPLSERVPVLENFGFVVIAERTYHIAPKRRDGSVDVIVLHDMVLETADGLPFDRARHGVALADAFLAVARDECENDGFNRLLLAALATWPEAAVLRAYAAYMRQIRLPFGLRYMSDVLVAHAGVAQDLIALFRTKFDPDIDLDTEGRERELSRIAGRIEGALTAVESIDEDRILRKMLALVRASVRTNFFQSTDRRTLAVKFDPALIDDLPEPRPYREIFVSSPRVEGVHLRFQPIARGGLRWSDRAQDFRTEVLGLAKAQQVKNTVIVPSGAKGGFVPKRLPKGGSRDDVQAEGTAAYRLFVESLLTITDNIVDGQVTPPVRVVRHDGDDPYLVVAADKGTATFSDLANGIAAEHKFWLGDAFASGGSAGYDHKVMGITARGAWECVKRHFREMDIDIQTMAFRVAGVGDMSGDVFGNGMLLSPAIRLVAAFDHRDIFIDPEPDPAMSFAERQRLFKLPRSSWRDYSATLISQGGGVFSRQAKAIPVSAQMAALLGVPAGDIAPAGLMRAILKLDVDLLWFGGIGTYVRSSTETDEQAGDRANDAVRITAAELRTKAIGEGANLGLTQRARIEASMRGVRLNTDFIDNSAGVNSSDIEVNIKVGLGPAVQSGRLGLADRNALLAAMTNDVAMRCLEANRQQSLAISLAERRGAREVGDARRLMHVLEARGLLDRRLESLPTDAELAQREASGLGLTRPELAVLLAWSKIAFDRDLLASPLPDAAGCQTLLLDYFPRAMRERFGDDLLRHRLRREIVATRITNSVVNRGGPAFALRLADETGRSVVDVAGAYLAARSLYDVPRLLGAIDALDNRIGGAAQLALYAELQHFIGAATAEILRAKGGDALGRVAERYAPAVATLAPRLDSCLTPAQQAARHTRLGRLDGLGAPDDLARTLAALPDLGSVPAIADIAAEANADLAAAAAALFAAESFVRLDMLVPRAAALRFTDYYDGLAVQGALGGLKRAARAMAAAATARKLPFAQWLAEDPARLGRVKGALDDLAAGGDLTVSRLVVAAAQVRDLSAG